MKTTTATAGKDKFGHFVLFGGFRSAMPDAATAARCAASAQLLAACELAAKDIGGKVPLGFALANLMAAIAKAAGGAA
jgi:hypothetical protein